MRPSVAAAVLGLALTGLLSAPAAGSTAAVADLNYKQVTNKNSAKCADVEAWSKDDGGRRHDPPVELPAHRQLQPALAHRRLTARVARVSRAAMPFLDPAMGCSWFRAEQEEGKHLRV
ncbi:hypothetical protein ACFVXA_18000 [Streptomyces sp. NPDC058246]|uniref:hypothetical protein n=1 Tax=Streptomyces sp. NPDC058246 TaxID=3346400 RepID=UPI0036E33A6D